MDFDNKALDKYLVEVKRIEESRSKGADKEIRSLYKFLLKKLNSFIGEYYTKYSDDNGVLNVAILQQNAKYASFLEEVDKNIKEVTPAISKTIKSTVEKTYKACFEGMINGFSNSAGDSKFKDSFNGLSIKPEVLKAAVENPISGLTLPERLQKHRQDVIYDIRQSISNSLMTGERFDTTSKKLMERLDVSYGKASRIVRTESHRVQEKGLMDGAEHINDKVKGDGLVYAAIWRNMGDEKVRPNIRVKTKKGWKTYKSHTNANHIKMEGQVVEAGGYFDLGNGVKAKSPGESGTPENDCNCRCTLEYEMMTVEEFEERGGKRKSNKKTNNIPNTDDKDIEITSSGNYDIVKNARTELKSNYKSFTNDNGRSIIIEEDGVARGYSSNFIYNKMSRKKRKEIIQKGQKIEKPVYSYDKKENNFPTYAQNIPKEPFTFDIISHGTDSCIDFFSKNSQNSNIDAYTLACILKGRNDYQEFINHCKNNDKKPVIRMLSCNTGNTNNTGDCFAQLLANELGVKVIAPNDILYVLPDGSFCIGRNEQGSFVEFYSRR